MDRRTMVVARYETRVVVSVDGAAIAEFTHDRDPYLHDMAVASWHASADAVCRVLTGTDRVVMRGTCELVGDSCLDEYECTVTEFVATRSRMPAHRR